MSDNTLDMRGQACPIPVVKTRKHLLSHPGQEEVRVILDNMASCENVARMARTMGWEARVEDGQNEEFHLILSGGQEGPGEAGGAAGAGGPADADQESCGTPSQVVVLVAGDTFGQGDPELGSILMRAFIKTVRELVPRPVCLIFLNSGVRITTEGSPVIETLQELETSGIEILSCGTCLDFYHLKEKLAVGQGSNMYEIASRLVGADRVVRL